MNKLQKGFTLIELLVVIAIIGILSSVVLASLNSARARGSDAAVKANLANIRAQAELVYDTDGNYDAVCANAQVVAAVAAATTAGGGAATCTDAAGTWVVSSPLRSGGRWCVDSTGASKANAAAPTGGVCNAS